MNELQICLLLKAVDIIHTCKWLSSSIIWGLLMSAAHVLCHPNSGPEVLLLYTKSTYFAFLLSAAWQIKLRIINVIAVYNPASVV